MNDEERVALAKKLDKDLESFVQSKIAESATKRLEEASATDNLTVDEFYDELRSHPAFMSELDESKPMSAAMEGLQALKYESESADENATSFKEDGNKNFGRKKYRWAIDNYSAGIKCQPTDKQLNAVLYTNRAAANFHIGNFRSAFTDCQQARRFVPDHLKAIIRGASCCVELKKYADAVQWCNEGLAISSADTTLRDLRKKAERLQKEEARDKRKEIVIAKREKAAEANLLEAIKHRGIKVDLSTTLDPIHPSLVRVTLGDTAVLSWPVTFVIPEYGEIDLVATFNEESRFADHLEAMYGEGGDRPAWDQHGCYLPQRIKIYFEDKENERLHAVKPESTLLQVLQHDRYIVQHGTPSFILLVDQSPFAKDFLAKYNK